VFCQESNTASPVHSGIEQAVIMTGMLVMHNKRRFTFQEVTASNTLKYFNVFDTITALK